MTCRIDDCAKPSRNTGLCAMHYARLRRHGDTHFVKRRVESRAPQGLTESERFRHHYNVVQSGCWEWNGHLTTGYGRFWLDADETGKQKSLPAHRAAWLITYGELPEDLDLDHLCVNPRCVNPSHLEPVTPKENMRRVAERNRRTWTTCQAGLHPYPENRITEASTGKSRCVECARIAKRKYKAKIKAERNANGC